MLIGILGLILVGVPGFFLVAAVSKGGDALWILMGAPVLVPVMIAGIVLIILAIALPR